MIDSHKIKRLEVALRVADQESARQLQQQVSSFCRDELPDILQSAFDAVAADRWLRIDRLELNLPSFDSADDVRRRLRERVRQSLQARLDDAAASAAAADATAAESVPGEFAPPRVLDAVYQAADIFIHVLEHGAAPWHALTTDFDAVVRDVIRILASDRSFGSQLTALLAEQPKVLSRFVLQVQPAERIRMVACLTRLDAVFIEAIERELTMVAETLAPGGTPLPADGALPAKIVIGHLIRHKSVDQEVRTAMLAELFRSLGMLTVRPFPTARVAPTLAGIQLEAALPAHWRPALRECLAGIIDPGSGVEAPDPEAAQGKPAAAAGPGADKPKAHVPALEALPKKDGVEAALHGVAIPLKAAHPQQRRAPGGQAQTENRDRSSVGQLRDIGASATAPTQDPEPAGLAPAFREQNLTRGRSIPPPGSAGTAPEFEPSIYRAPGSTRPGRGGEFVDIHTWRSPFEAEMFHIDNAGLVLLAPFFGRVFKNLGYLDQQRHFVSDAARTRAVHFSQFLVTAEQHPAECSLVLNKILCGLAVAEPVQRFVELSEDERAAAGEVVDSALQHWSALKRTSAPVFRETFLQHVGILGRGDGHWLLRIERTAVDVLLDSLPWAISIIKHPWMHQALMVDW